MGQNSSRLEVSRRSKSARYGLSELGKCQARPWTFWWGSSSRGPTSEDPHIPVDMSQRDWKLTFDTSQEVGVTAVSAFTMATRRKPGRKQGSTENIGRHQADIKPAMRFSFI